MLLAPLDGQNSSRGTSICGVDIFVCNSVVSLFPLCLVSALRVSVLQCKHGYWPLVRSPPWAQCVTPPVMTTNTGLSLVTWWSRDPDTGLSLADCDTHMMTPDCLTWADREEPGPGPSNLQSHYEQFWLWCRVSCAVVNGYSPDFLEAIEDRRQHSSWDENQQEVHSVLPSLSGYGLILHI